MSSVFLLSLYLETESKAARIGLRFFQFLVFCCVIISLSKMAILTLALGIAIIYRKKGKYLLGIGLGLLVFFSLIYVVFALNLQLDFVTRRFFTTSGHLSLFLTSVEHLKNLSAWDLFFGNGIGSIPEFSSNKFLISRIYEGGVVGLLFVLYVSALPLLAWFQKLPSSSCVKNKSINFAVLFSIIAGFHVYDNFLYIWPWIIIGSIISSYWNAKEEN